MAFTAAGRGSSSSACDARSTASSGSISSCAVAWAASASLRAVFSFWIAPEIGKLLSPGNVFYAKPGWGVDPDRFDREFTFEMGWRYFF